MIHWRTVSSFSVLMAALTFAAIGTSDVWAQAASGANSGQRVTIEPYTGPAILLDEPEKVAPTVVERQTLRNERYDGGSQVRVERGVVRYSDDTIEADGVYREFYPDGKPFVEGRYADGRKDGEWTFYHPNGSVNRKVTYKDGQPDGAIEIRRPDNTLAAKREFVAGRRSGEWIFYNESGEKPIREERYADGKQDGVWRTWFPSGQLRQEIGFKAGVKHGPSKEWDEDGQVRADLNYVDGKLDGKAIVVMPNGRRIEQTYEAGKLLSN